MVAPEPASAPGGPSANPTPEAAQTPPPAPTPETAHGGPWKPVGKSHIGDQVYENPNGVRAVMENGVPWTEGVHLDAEKGMVPRNPGDRKRQFLVEGEDFAAPKPNPVAPEPKADWTLLGTNHEGLPVYSNPQGVHSVVENGARDVERVRLRETPVGMAMEVPGAGDKGARFRVVRKAEAEAPSEVGRPSEAAKPPAAPKAAGTPLATPPGSAPAPERLPGDKGPLPRR